MFTRLFLSILFLLTFWTGVLAQEAATEKTAFPDLLYLRDGSVLEGNLEVYVHRQYLIFQLATGDKITIPASEVQRVVQGGALLPPEDRASRQHLPKPYRFQERGLYHNVNGGLSFGSTSQGGATTGWSAGYGAGFLFNRWVGLGGGLGIDSYYLEAGEVIYPLYGEVRGYLSGRKIAPFYRVAAGYGFAFRNEGKGILEAEGGAYFQPSLGFRWGGGAGLNLTTDLGFRFQEAAFTRELLFRGIEREVENLRYKRIVLQIGIVF